MAREEAMEELSRLPVGLMDLTNEQKWDLTEAIDIALSALRPVSREQVKKVWRGEWTAKHYIDGILEGINFDECSKCGYQRVIERQELKTKFLFCPQCGAPMTDEAVEMVVERLEALKDGKAD